MTAMELFPPHVVRAAEQTYTAYGDHAQWAAYNGSPMPSWADLPEDTQQHWCAAITALMQQLISARLFKDNAQCILWSNAHGGWWHKSMHGYTLDVGQAARMTPTTAMQLTDQAAADLLDPKCKALPEIVCLAPEERWDTPPQIPDGTIRLDTVNQVTGLAKPRYLPFSLEPHETLQGLALQVYGADVFVQGFVQHENGPLHTICRRIGEDDEDQIDKVQT